MFKKLLVTLSCLGLMLAFATSSFAAQAWYTCGIAEVGNSSVPFVILTNCVNTSTSASLNGGADTYTVPRADAANTQMAIALTAVSLGSNVGALFDPAIANPQNRTLTSLKISTP